MPRSAAARRPGRGRRCGERRVVVVVGVRGGVHMGGGRLPAGTTARATLWLRFSSCPRGDRLDGAAVVVRLVLAPRGHRALSELARHVQRMHRWRDRRRKMLLPRRARRRRARRRRGRARACRPRAQRGDRHGVGAALRRSGGPAGRRRRPRSLGPVSVARLAARGRRTRRPRPKPSRRSSSSLLRCRRNSGGGRRRPRAPSCWERPIGGLLWARPRRAARTTRRCRSARGLWLAAHSHPASPGAPRAGPRPAACLGRGLVRSSRPCAGWNQGRVRRVFRRGLLDERRIAHDCRAVPLLRSRESRLRW